MNKGIKALNRLTGHIETEFGSDDYYEVKSARDVIEKELKAMEIIRREPSMVCWQASYEDYEEYIENTPEEHRFIENKEEFDLLKEVLP